MEFQLLPPSDPDLAVSLNSRRCQLTTLRESWFKQTTRSMERTDRRECFSTRSKSKLRLMLDTNDFGSTDQPITSNHMDRAASPGTTPVPTETAEGAGTRTDTSPSDRLGPEARLTLGCRSPTAPRASKWGLLFDSMVAKLRSKNPQDRRTCLGLASRWSSLSSGSGYHWDERDMETAEPQPRCPTPTSRGNSVPDFDQRDAQGCSNSGATRASRPASLITAGVTDYWEENWPTPSTSPADENEACGGEACSACQNGQAAADGCRYSINLCYKNHSCQREARAREPESGSPGREPAKHPEGDEAVWKPQPLKAPAPASKQSKLSVWKRFKRLFIKPR